MNNEDEANSAIQELTGTLVKGSRMRVEVGFCMNTREYVHTPGIQGWSALFMLANLTWYYSRLS